MTLLFAGGGSGGHIFPALAIAERVAELDPAVRCVYACSDRPVDARVLQGRETLVLPARPWSWRPGAAWRFARGFAAGRRRVGAALRERGVHHVVSTGGFVAAPAVAAARTMGIPCTLVNLDAVPGKANRWMARRCARVVSAVPCGLRGEVTGMPLRRAALTCEDAASSRRRFAGLDPLTPTLLVCGGSQGAATLNRLMSDLVATRPGDFSGWQVLHISGEEAAPPLRADYAAARIRAVVLAFTDQMGSAWGAADLALSRAGAGSVAEAAANGVPVLFLPYPFHRDHHQERNARPLCAAGGALVCRDHVDPQANSRDAGEHLLRLMRDEANRRAMRAALLRRPRPDAALAIARMILHESSGRAPAHS
jgi:UDP-N-acetylglucosamine--N-acetylmuramyl-(pentapeptide) pyrophosphoryl-undecaprenol N-acetylglucosamine transferase